MLPRLLYVGDVPVEASYHGSALLYRLLSDYPRERVTIIETATPSEPQRRLPGVNYISRPIGNQRFLNTRFHPYALVWYLQVGDRMNPKITLSLDQFQFESVLTVVHGFGWLAAARIARERNVPLHLMVHDDWPRVAHVPPRFRKWLDKRFASVYRQARSRLCVSPAMSRAYLDRYGEPSDVIFPSWSRDAAEFDGPPARLHRNEQPFTIAFAGTINSFGYVHALLALQDALRAHGGRMLIFGPLTPEEATAFGLDDPITELRGLLPASELLTRLREEVDALFVPMSFDAFDRTNMELAFPSKLADCTATGLPLLIYGPDYCSAVTWARENPGVAQVVETEKELGRAVEQLANDPARRVALGKRGLEVGRQYFNHERVQQVFHQALSA